MAHDDHDASNNADQSFSSRLRRLREWLSRRLFRRYPPLDGQRPREDMFPIDASRTLPPPRERERPHRPEPPPVILMPSELPAEPPVATAEELHTAPQPRETGAAPADTTASPAAPAPPGAEPAAPPLPAVAGTPRNTTPAAQATAAVLGTGTAGPPPREPQRPRRESEPMMWGPRRRARNGFDLALHLAQRPGFCCCCWCLGPNDTRRAKRIFALVRAIKRAERGLPPRRRWFARR